LDEGGDVGSFFFVNLKAGAAQCSTMEQFHAIELHIGDLYNIHLADNAIYNINDADNATPIHFGHFEVYNPETKRADISFSTLEGISLHSSVGPISEEEFEEVRHKFDRDDIREAFSNFFHDPSEVTLEFKSVWFFNSKCAGWKLGPFGDA
jgi:hypothetical protein